MEREVYAKVGNPGRWLFVDMYGKWMVGSTANKDDRKTDPPHTPTSPPKAAPAAAISLPQHRMSAANGFAATPDTRTPAA